MHIASMGTSLVSPNQLYQTSYKRYGAIIIIRKDNSTIPTRRVATVNVPDVFLLEEWCHHIAAPIVLDQDYKEYPT